jgi:hypothetical protein
MPFSRALTSLTLACLSVGFGASFARAQAAPPTAPGIDAAPLLM